jgi:hypothetical protein
MELTSYLRTLTFPLYLIVTIVLLLSDLPVSSMLAPLWDPWVKLPVALEIRFLLLVILLLVFFCVRLLGTPDEQAFGMRVKAPLDSCIPALGIRLLLLLNSWIRLLGTLDEQASGM